MKKKLLDKFTSRAFKKSMKIFIVWMVIFALFIYAFINFVFWVKDSIPVSVKPSIKGEVSDGLIAEETENPAAVGNITIT